MSFFQPTDYSGLFLWFRSTDIGPTTDGVPITYWPDMSGSGNNLGLSISGSAQTPTFKKNIVNGYPVARFNGSSNFLYLANNSTLNLSPSNLTLFMVYQTFSDTQTQCVCSNDNDSFIQGSKNGFVSFLNFNGQASGWSWAWGKDPHQFGENKISAIAQNGSGQIIGKNDFTLRTDFFHPITQMFTWARFGTPIASGVGSMSISNSNNFKLGWSADLNCYLIGDIAEIVAYNRMLGLSELDQVHQYLLYKYALDPTKQCPLFTWGVGPPESGIYLDIPLIISGSAPISSGFTLYEQGINPINYSTTLYIGASTTISGSKSLYIGSSTEISGFPPLYIYSYSSGNLSCSLYTHSSTMISGGSTLYEFGVFRENSSIPLFIYPRDQIPSGHINLFLNSSTLTPSGLDLFISGAIYSWLTTPLYMIAGTEVRSFPLYIDGFTSGVGGTTLYIGSTLINSGSFSLFIFPRASGVGGLPLYINNIAPTIYSGINNINLIVNGSTHGTSGLSVGKALFIKGLGQYDVMPLFISTDPLITSGTIGIGPFPLYMYGPQTTGTNSNSIPLFMQNTTQIQNSPRLKLWVRGDGVMDGASIAKDGMNLVINTLQGQYDNLPLYIGSTNSVNSGITLFTNSFFNINSGVSMFVGGVGNTGSIPLYIYAGGSFSSGISLIMSGLPTITNNVSLYNHGF